MSDFLARLAARAVGSAVTVQPRVPALFEGPERSPPVLEVVEEEVAAAPSPVRADRSTDSGAVAQRREADVARPRFSRADPPPVPESAASGRSASSEDGDVLNPEASAPPAPTTVPVPPAIRPRSTQQSTPRAAEDEEPAAGRPASPALSPPPGPIAVVPAVPALSPGAAEYPADGGPQASRLEDRSATDDDARDAPLVRVHIGRLEVRANLQMPPETGSRRPDERTPPAARLTLSDYLRGERRAR